MDTWPSASSAAAMGVPPNCVPSGFTQRSAPDEP